MGFEKVSRFELRSLTPKPPFQGAAEKLRFSVPSLRKAASELAR